jgi:DNA-binding response OmpR family regulator
MQPNRSILLADEDPAARAFLADNLAADGYQVLLADSKSAAIATLETSQPDLVICDVNGETLDLIDAVRRSDGLAARLDPDVPLIVLTARADALARVRYFDRGGDDVISKPFSYIELRARIGAVLRRSRPRERGRVTRVGALRIDHASRAVRLGDTPIALTATEYRLLAQLAADPARVFTKHELLRDVWGFRAPYAEPAALSRADGRFGRATREDHRTLVRRLPTDEGHHASPPRAAIAGRLRSPRLRRAAVLAAPPRLRHRATRTAAVP